jgi:hypothetical protein
MTATISCEALRDDIIALLYDDGLPGERSRARDHLAQCVPCRVEYADLKGVRKALGGWNLPAPAPLPQARPAVAWFPAGLAAAAGLILGIGLALAGRSTLFPPSSAPMALDASSARSTSNPQFVSYGQLQEALAAQESRHQAEITDLRRSLTLASASANSPVGALPVGAQTTGPALSTATIERLLKASEDRQARMIETRLAGLRTENDLQRQYDMAQIAAGLAYIDSRTGADAARTSELMKNLVRVTAKPQDR